MSALFQGLICLQFLTFNARAQHRFDVWSTDNGLPHNFIHAIKQTKDGYLWLTTLDGLVRFDGARFTIFNTGNTRGFASNRLTGLFEDRTGALWIGTEEDGVMRYHDGRFTTYTTLDGLPNNEATIIQDDLEGNPLISTWYGIARWKAGRLETYFNRKDRRVYLRFDFRDKEGAIWHRDGAGLHRLKDNQTTDYPLPGIPGFLGIYAMHEDRQGALWIATEAGLARLQNGRPEVFTEKDGLPSSAVNAICEDREGNLWLGTRRGLVQFKDGRFASLGLAEQDISALLEDREGSLWIATRGNGLYRLRKEVITVFSQQQGLSTNIVYPIFEDHLGEVWIGTWPRGLSRYKDGLFSAFPMQGYLPASYAEALAEDREGRLWIGGIDNLSWMKEGKLNDFTGQLGIPFHDVTAILQDCTGAMWFGLNTGLVRHRAGRATVYTTKDGLAGDDIKAILEARNGDLWIGSYGGLTRISNGQFTRFTVDQGLVSNRVRVVYEDPSGVIWIGTYDGGLSRLKDGRIKTCTTREGLFNNGVFQILEDDRGYLWMSCNLGIYRIRKQQLDDLFDGKVKTVSSIAYGKSDGLVNPECNGGRQPAGIRARDGRMWFPTLGGVAILDPAKIPFNPLAPQVIIESCVVDGEAMDLRNPISIAPGKRNIEVNYTATSFIKPEFINFKYQLEGLSDDWVEPGTRRTAYFSYIPPGEYVFSVIAANSDGVWNSEGAQLRIVMRPPFWQTWWFMTLSLLAIAGAVAGFYRRRIAQLQRANAAQEAFSRRLIESQEGERKRIAAELHDGLGQSLAIIKNRALLSLGVPDDHERALEQLDEIAAAATYAIDEAKEIAYNLRPYHLDRLGLTKALGAMIRNVSESHGTAFEIEIDDLDGVFSKEAEINLYRIVQESVNNIVKHADATQARIVIRKNARSIGITVHDNGKGFAIDSPNSRDRAKGGFGLIGIAERARMLGGSLAIDSAPGKGTTITMELDFSENRGDFRHGY